MVRVHFHTGSRMRHRIPIVIIPPSTDRTIVFPYNFAGRCFRTMHYSPAMTPGNVPTQEVEHFLADIDLKLEPYHRALMSRFVNFLKYIVLLLVLALFIVVIISIVKTVTEESKGKVSSENHFIPGVPIAGAITVGYTFFVALLSTICKCRANGKLPSIRNDVEAYIAQRAPDFKARGLYWVLPDKFPYWIELWREDSALPLHNNYNMQPMGMYGGSYSQPGQIQFQMQPMQMQIQPQQGYYMQDQFGGSSYR